MGMGLAPPTGLVATPCYTASAIFPVRGTGRTSFNVRIASRCSSFHMGTSASTEFGLATLIPGWALQVRFAGG